MTDIPVVSAGMHERCVCSTSASFSVKFMKSTYFAFILFLCLVYPALCQTGDINIIPRPNSVTRLDGEFTLTAKTQIVVDDDAGRRSAALLNDLLQRNYGLTLKVTKKKRKKDAIYFVNMGRHENASDVEEYILNVEPDIVLASGEERGMFYAIQSLMQLTPVEARGEIKIPAVKITDKPRFGYRGMHLDTSRHFMPVEFVKKYIDLMAQYKFNTFHWHLTDDQGWRIEIKKYPKLTEIGSKRKESVKERNLTPYIGDGIPVEGFYTQEQIRDVVAYAKAKHITTVPEIELPGHASAAISAARKITRTRCRRPGEFSRKYFARPKQPLNFSKTS
jgi:hexosaminidase